MGRRKWHGQLGEVRVERGCLGDLADLVALERRCFDPSVAIAGRQFRYLLARPTAQILVIRERGRVVADAVILYRRNARGLLGRIYSLVVSPESRGRGYGRILIQAGMEWLRQIGAYAVVLEAHVGNAAALQLYEKEGFCRGRVLGDYYGRGEDGVRLSARMRGT